MEIDIVDQYSLTVECFNHDLMESDELVGTAQCSLLPAFKRGQYFRKRVHFIVLPFRGA